MKKSDFKKFKCRQCGECCKGDGVVKVTDGDIANISGFLKISKEEFLSKYTRHGFFEEIWLKDKTNMECIFLNGNICEINCVKPLQCINFPYSWQNSDTQSACPAMAALINETKKRNDDGKR